MKASFKIALVCLGMAGLALAAESAQADVTLNGSGSSAGRQFAGLAPAFLCDAGTATFFTDGLVPPTDSEFQCVRGGNQATFRYHASGSSDGYTKQTASWPQTELFLNSATSTCANAGSPVAVGPVSVQTKVCSVVVKASMPVHYGASDVVNTSFHFTNISASGVSTNPVVSVPFSFAVGANVRQYDTNGTTLINLKSLTREEVEMIYSGNVTDWTTLGYNVSAGSSTISLCERTNGSGTKATLDEVVLINADESTTPNVPQSGSSGNMKTCLQNNLNSIGYIDADTTLAGGSYYIGLDGTNAPTGTTASKKAIRCGKYPFWANWNIIRRTANLDTLAGVAPGTNAALNALIDSMQNNNPLPGFWMQLFFVAPQDAFVLKNDDKGPLVPTGGGETVCRG